MYNRTESYRLLEKKHPHITKKIQLMWGSFEMNQYFNELFLDSRDGNRKGFDKDVAISIFELSNMHQEEFPQFVKNIPLWYDAR